MNADPASETVVQPLSCEHTDLREHFSRVKGTDISRTRCKIDKRWFCRGSNRDPFPLTGKSGIYRCRKCIVCVSTVVSIYIFQPFIPEAAVSWKRFLGKLPGFVPAAVLLQPNTATCWSWSRSMDLSIAQSRDGMIIHEPNSCLETCLHSTLFLANKFNIIIREVTEA
jgi:hypothetical protein